MKSIHTLTVQFSNGLSQSEIPFFRGAVIHAMQDADVLFHNHTEDGLRYRYPLIQYKRINGKAAIVCIEDGIESIEDFFNVSSFDAYIGNRPVTLSVENLVSAETFFEAGDAIFQYRIHKWIPFNQDNFKAYSQMESIVDRYVMLERLLVGNILSFAKGVDIHIDNEVIVSITDIGQEKSFLYKGVNMKGFDLSFKSNVTLPDDIGLGKGVSLGFGRIEHN